MTPKTLESELEPRPGESDEARYIRIAAFLCGDDIRSKDDLRDWTGSPPFHLDKP